MWPVALLLALALASAAPASAQTPIPQADAGVPAAQPEVLAAIRVQGNVAATDDEVRALAGIPVGAPVGPGTADEVAARLRASKRFDRVDVMKRFASIADPTQIVLVVIVDEGPVRIEMTGDPNHPTRVVRSHRPNVLFLPVLETTDGYGLTYGVRLATPDVAGPHSRLYFPLTWGGVKLGGIELEKRFDSGPISRILAGGSVSSTASPYYHESLDRQRTAIRVEHDVTKAIRLGITGGWQHVTFPGADDSFTHEGADVTVDTRIDPFLARNAVYARAAVDRFNFAGGGTTRTDLLVRGHIGLVGQPILVLTAARIDSNRPMPDYFRPQLGGVSNLRGFDAGFAVGDTLVAGSAELLVPIGSPLSLGKIGVDAFTDAGSVYDKGQRLADQPLYHSFGGGVWFAAAFIRLGVDVAHGVGAGTRVQFGASALF